MPEGHIDSAEGFQDEVPLWKATESPLGGVAQPFYRTSALPCPYLPGRFERKLVTEISGPNGTTSYSDLCRAGFRRSHNIAYRTACFGCEACVPVRIAVAAFGTRRSRRRIMSANADLTGYDAGRSTSDEQYQLFQRYQHTRHADGDMAGMGFSDYRGMVEQSTIDTRLFEFRDRENRLWGACLTDCLDDGLSAVYSFFDPGVPERSLGSYIVHWLVERAKAGGLPYVYLGYWIAESGKMAYKRRFRPLEGLCEGRWQVLPP